MLVEAIHGRASVSSLLHFLGLPLHTGESQFLLETDTNRSRFAYKYGFRVITEALKVCRAFSSMPHRRALAPLSPATLALVSAYGDVAKKVLVCTRTPADGFATSSTIGRIWPTNPRSTPMWIGSSVATSTNDSRWVASRSMIIEEAMPYGYGPSVSVPYLSPQRASRSSGK